MERRLLYIASTYSHIVTFHRPYLRQFSDRGWMIDVACGGREIPIPEADRTIHVPLEKSITSPKNWLAMLQLRKEIRTNHYDLICCHTTLASFFVRMALLGMRNRPLVACTVHGYLFDDDTPLPRRLLLSGAELLTAPVTDLLMAMNRWDYEEALRFHLGKQIVFIPGVGVDFSKLEQHSQADCAALRQQYSIPSNAFVLLFAAEFSARKNQETLIRALAQLPEQAVLVLAGRGDLLGQCRALAESLGLKDRVIFPGFVDNIGLWYSLADAAVSSSRTEGLPFNIMEAMYCGLPVVATSVKGHTDLISHEKNGLLFPYGDSDACALQLRRLLDDPELCSRFGEQGHKDVQPYSLDVVLPRIMSYYDELLALER